MKPTTVVEATRREGGRAWERSVLRFLLVRLERRSGGEVGGGTGRGGEEDLVDADEE